MVHEPAVLIEGVLFRARYLGSTQLTCEGRTTKTTRMVQAQEAVSRIKVGELFRCGNSRFAEDSSEETENGIAWRQSVLLGKVWILLFKADFASVQLE